MPHIAELTLRPGRFSLPHVLTALQVAQACNLEQAQERCLAAVAHALAAAGAQAQELLTEDALAALDSSTLAQLVLAVAVAKAERQPSGSRPAAMVDVVVSGAFGGFTFVVPGFGSGPIDSALMYKESPWVEVGGFRWRLDVRTSLADDVDEGDQPDL